MKTWLSGWLYHRLPEVSVKKENKLKCFCILKAKVVLPEQAAHLVSD